MFLGSLETVDVTHRVGFSIADSVCNDRCEVVASKPNVLREFCFCPPGECKRNISSLLALSFVSPSSGGET